MSGSRCKALKREFIKVHREAPGWLHVKDGVVSEWRRLKKLHRTWVQRRR